MPTSTTNYGWQKPDVGASIDAWGGLLNTDLDGIDSTVKSVSNAIPTASSTTPAMDGTAAVGTGTTWARADHVHPSDTSRLALSGGTMIGALTPQTTGGLVGTTLGDNANAGSIGEVISSVITTNVPLTSNTPANVTSITLTAGDWDVFGEVWIAPSVTGGGAMFVAISTVSATVPSTVALGTSRAALTIAFTTGSNCLAPCPCRASLSASTTYYLVAQFNNQAGNATGKIWARRAR